MLKYLLKIRLDGTLFFIFLISLSCFAQVVIEERVEIGSNSVSALEKETIVSSLIMPRSGMLQVYYTYLVHLDGPMPYYSSLNTFFFKGDSTKSDDLAIRFDDFFYWQRNFGPYCFPSIRWEYDYFASEYLYELGNVNAGDTVQFTYYSDWVANGQPFEYGIYDTTGIWVNNELVGWDVIFGNYWCNNAFDNVLYISVGVLKEYELMVSIEPVEIAPGDTADIILKKKLPDGTLVDFDTTQTFEVGMLEGCMSGKLLTGTPPDTGSYFYNVHQPIRFAAADSLAGDSSGVVIIRVGVVDSVEERINREKRLRGIMPDAVIKKTKGHESDTLSLFCFNPMFWQTEIFENDTLTIEKKTILLGETKYYQAKRNTSTSKLKIEEIEPDENGIPQQQTGTVNGWEWLTEDVWTNEPLSVVECDSCGRRMGVYWEKKYPTNQFEDIIIGKKKYRIVKMDSLDSGLIRILGRYWTSDSIYTVNLKAHYSNDSTDIKLTVKKPSNLGDTFGYTTDVFSTSLNIDSLIIKYSGESGISPVLTKGQMFQEAWKVNEQFKPSYRYEPFYEVNKIRKEGKTNQYFNPNLPFVVSSSGMGSGDPIPTSHTNVYPISYPTSPIEIGQFFFDNFGEYRKNLSDGTIEIIGGDDLTEKWNQLYDYYIDTLNYQQNLAKQKAIDTLKTEVRDGLYDSLYLEYAQTRKIASYGFLQILGITPIDKGYYLKTDPSKPPEKINEQDILMPMYVWLIKKNLKTSMNNEEPINNWPRGYEAELTRSFFYYNGSKNYAKEVYTNSKSFKPKG